MSDTDTMNGMHLSVHEATVHTVTVQIRTLTIGPKQMTLAVFRQLIDEILLAYVGAELRGTPWGTVNYHPDKMCDDLGQHFHVVWQKGDELRKDTFCRSELRHPAGDAIWKQLEELPQLFIAV